MQLIKAWNNFSKKDYDTAMKRCNQSWLIDHDNYNVYWCYGEILFYMNNGLDQSAVYFDKAISIYSTNNELFANDYLRLYRDAFQVYIDISNKYLNNDITKSKQYAEKVISLLVPSLKNEVFMKIVNVPFEKLILAQAYFNEGLYSESRKIYDEVMKTPTDLINMNTTKQLDSMLKGKGY